jgi:hypothetical protein
MVCKVLYRQVSEAIMKTKLYAVTQQPERLFLGLTAAAVLSFSCFLFFVNFKKDQKSAGSINHNIDYEMAKVKSSEMLYSLDGREIDRLNHELETTTQTKAPVAATAAAAAVNTQKQPATAPKNKASQSKTAQKKAQAEKKIAEAKNKNNINDSTITQTDVGLTDIKKTMNSTSAQNFTTTQSAPVGLQEKSEDQSNSKKNVKTIAQWSKEIFASTDRQIILKFVAALKNKEITEAEFYSVVDKLLASTEEAKKGFGLYALRASTSYGSYVALIRSQKTLNATYQAYVQEGLLSYNQSSSLGYLHQALNSDDKEIVLKTFEIIKTGLTEIKNGTTSALVESRYRRETSFTNFNIQSYQAFLPQLTALQSESQQSGDQDVYNGAGQLSQVIQANSVVAANP